MELNKICRICLKNHLTMKSIFSTELGSKYSIKVYEMLKQCCSIDVELDDGLPSQVCSPCLSNVVQVYSFIKLCKESDQTLRLATNNEISPKTKEIKSKNAQFLDKDTLSDSLNIDAVSDFSITNESPNFCPIEMVCGLSSEKTMLALDVKYLENLSDFSDEVSYSHEEIKTNKAFIKSSPKKRIQNSEYESLPKISEEKSKTENNSETCKIRVKPLNSLKNDANNFPSSLTKQNEENLSGLSINTDNSMYSCEYCQNNFTTKISLQDHLKTIHKKFVCKVCDKRFASLSTLCRHVKAHEMPRRHLCNECGKSFFRSDELTRHMLTHTGEKPFNCNLCEKSFAQSFRLLEHMRAHANKKQFKCSECGKAFSRHASLSAHKKTHLGIKTHQCSICGKKFCSSGSLQLHMKIHTGTKDKICPDCGKGFTCSSSLIVHKRIHTGEKPYVCSICSKGFPDPSRLTVHFRSHSGEKPYVCNICQKGCITSSLLKRHLRIHIT